MMNRSCASPSNNLSISAVTVCNKGSVETDEEEQLSKQGWLHRIGLGQVQITRQREGEIIGPIGSTDMDGWMAADNDSAVGRPRNNTVLLVVEISFPLTFFTNQLVVVQTITHAVISHQPSSSRG
jgi:hypothetical protein